MADDKRTLCVRTTCLLIFLTLSLGVAFADSSPQVVKVEPPNWWIGLPPEPMLLLYGDHLAGAQVTTAYSGVHIDRVQDQSDGHHVFVWLTLENGVRPGNVPLKVLTSAGTAAVDFPLNARGDNKGPFQGISPDDVIYLIMPDRFADGDPANDEPSHDRKTFDRGQLKAWHGGDLQGIREHLPYLKELGITALWLTPVWKNDWRADDTSYHGYHVVDFYAVDEHFGNMSDLQNLIEDAHRYGIKFILDYVVNHTGPNHPWATMPPLANWLHGSPRQHLSPAYDFAPLVDPHATPNMSRPILEGWFAGKLPDLNPDDPLLAQYFLQNAEWWLQSTGADALRLDTFPYSSRRFWSGWHTGLLRAFPQTVTVGEVWNMDPFITSFFAGGRRQFDGVDSQVTSVFDFPSFGAIRDMLLRGGSARKLAEVLEHDSLFPRLDMLVTFIGNHDTRRFMGEQNASTQKLKAAFALLLTTRGIPQIYSGDEIAMSGGDDPDNRRDFPGGFPGDKRNAFTSSGRTGDEQDVFAYVQSLLELRRAHPALRGGRQWHIAVDDNYYAFLREDGRDRVLVIFNHTSDPNHIRLDLADTPLSSLHTLSPLVGGVSARLAEHSIEADMMPESVAIFEVK
jgi:glycosidase